MIRKLIFFLSAFLLGLSSVAQIVYSDPNQNLDIEKDVFYLEDTKDKYSIKEVIISENFKPIINKVQNFGITSSAVWFRLSIRNITNIENLILIVNQPIIDQIDFYAYDSKTKSYPPVKLGEYKPFNQRTYQTPDYCSI
jgi:hypothetical protein